MDSTQEHNSALIQNGYFTSADLEANRKGVFSKAQLQRFENERNHIKSTAKKYDNKGWLISLIFGLGALFFAFVLYFVGVFDILQETLGSLFLPLMCAAGFFAALLVFVIIPRQYKASVDMYQSMGTSLKEEPLGEIQIIEARAEIYKSQGGINRRGHQSSAISHILQMKGIKFRVTQSLLAVIESKRLYRVHAVNDQGSWVLLSMEALE